SSSRAVALSGRRVTSVRWAAAMTAASGEAQAGASMVPRYGSLSPVIALTASKTASCTIAPQRVCTLGLLGGTITVACMIAFQSRTTSARVVEARPAANAIASVSAADRKSFECLIALLLSLGLHYDERTSLPARRPSAGR